jgi:hypothetical protein
MSDNGTIAPQKKANQLRCEMNPSVPNDRQPLQSTSNSVRRRRRPKRHFGNERKSTIHAYDEWYDTEHQIFSGYVTPLEPDLRQSLPEKNKPLSLPELMYERELYGRFGSRHIRTSTPLINRILLDTKDVVGSRETQKLWRPYCKQALKFSCLRKKIMDAVIGISPYGNYLVSLECAQFLTLRICGVPNSKDPLQSVAPLLLSIPLIGSTNMSKEIGDNIGYGWQYSPEQCPLRVWLSSDERLGICMYRKLWCHTAHVVLFPLPPAIPTLGDGFLFYQLNHVHVPFQAKQDLSPIDDCNLLVCVPFCPCRKSASTFEGRKNKFWLCDQIKQGLVAYIFLIDEEDGFRTTWIQESLWNDRETFFQYVLPVWECEKAEANTDNVSDHEQRRFKPYVVHSTVETRIVVQVSEIDSGWEQIISDPTIAKKCEPYSDEMCRRMAPRFTIAFTGFLSITALLSDILTRRPTLVNPVFCNLGSPLPNFTYHLIQVKDGRIVEVLLVFSVGKVGSGCVGVFVEVDLLTQDYQEMEWIRHQAHDTPPSTCAKLALDRHKSHTDNKAVETMTGDSLMEILYPDCVVMDNKAIRRRFPTTFMSARSAPVSISYI